MGNRQGSQTPLKMFKGLLRGVVHFFRRGVFSNLGTKLVSVVISLILWVVVLGSRSVEVTKEVPLEVITAGDVVVSNDVPDKVQFKLSGPKAFLRGVLDRREDAIRLNLVGEKAGLVTRRFFSDHIRVPIGVKVQSINPTAILIKLEPLKHRDVPVKLEIKGSLPEGYKLERIRLSPEVVTIKGAASKIEAITEISTLPLSIQNMRTSFVKEVALDLERFGVKLDGVLPKAMGEIIPTSANFRIRNVEVKVLSDHKAQFEERFVTVWIRADAKTIKQLDKAKILVPIDLRGKAKGRYTEKIKLQLPDEVGLVKIQPEELKVMLY